VSPHKFKRGELPTLTNPAHEWDPKPWLTLSQQGWVRGVQGGEAPMAGGLGDVPPE